MRRNQDAEVREQVPNFCPLIETEAAHHKVFPPIPPQRFFNLPRLEIGPIEHGHALGGIRREDALHGIGNEQSFVLAVQRLVKPDLVSLTRIGPQPLALAFGIVRHHRAGGFEDVLRRAVILLESNHSRVRIIALEIENVPNVRATPAIDRLILVTHHANVLVPLRKQPHQLILSAIGVLILIDHQEFVAPRVLTPQILVVLQQADGFQQKIVEIEGIGLPEAILITLVHHGQPRRFRIFRRTVHILRRLLVALGVGNPGAHGPVLHELFVEPDVAEDLLDQRHLIVVVVDVELASEAGAYVGETGAIAPQRAHAEGVKRRHQRSRAMLRVA